MDTPDPPQTSPDSSAPARPNLRYAQRNRPTSKPRFPPTKIPLPDTCPPRLIPHFPPSYPTPRHAHILVGFFKSERRNAAAAPPKDEWEPLLRNAVEIEGHPTLTVYARALPPGRNSLDFGPGAFAVLGFVKNSTHLAPRMVFFGPRPDLDWLFE